MPNKDPERRPADPLAGLPLSEHVEEAEVVEVREGQPEPAPEPPPPQARVPVMNGLDIPALAATTPEQVVAAVTVYHESLATLRRLALSELKPRDLRLYQPDDGGAYACIAASGARKIMWHVGIQVVPDFDEPRIKEEPDGSRTAWITGEGRWTMGRLTVPGIYAARNSEEEFAGRQVRTRRLSNGETRTTSTEPIANNDLKSAARTLLDSKVVEAMLGVGDIPVADLEARGVPIADIPRAHGFGSADDRRARQTAAPEVRAKAAKLWQACLQIKGGSKEDAADLLQSISKATKPGKDGKVFAGHRSVDRMTQDWQVDRAIETLKRHPDHQAHYGEE